MEVRYPRPTNAAGFVHPRFGYISTDPDDTDTDGDDRSDAEELGDQRVMFLEGNELYYQRLTSDPSDSDTDGDRLLDGAEAEGWSVPVVEKEGEPIPYRWYNGDPLAEDEANGTMNVTSNPLWADTDGDGVSDRVENRTLHTDPRDERTYAITREHQAEIVDALYEAWEDTSPRNRREVRDLMRSAQALGLVEDGTPRQLGDVELTDATDDFDFVTADDGSLVFTALDRTERTDTWLSNRGELDGGTDPWDPDTDDDGLTDGQEVHWVTEADPGELSSIEKDTLVQNGLPNSDSEPNLDPTDPDTDDDGWWDGWIGVYDVGRTDNVVLYLDNLNDGDGIEGHEIVQEQVGVHRVRKTTWSDHRSDLVPTARGAEISDDDWLYHSNVHIGELHWETNPDAEIDTAHGDTQLTVEVDHIEGRDPNDVTTASGPSVLDAAGTNFRLYGLDVQFQGDDEIPINELESTCKSTDDLENVICNEAPDLHPAPKITPAELNRHELGIIEDLYHDDSTSLHLLWGTTLRNDRPKTIIDQFMDYDRVEPVGIAFNTGAPGTENLKYVENDFGVMIAADEFRSGDVHGLQSVTMHELGHALGVGWADDTRPPWIGHVYAQKGYEVYSGNLDDPDLEGGLDSTPEFVEILGGQESEWSLMMAGEARDTRLFTDNPGDMNVLGFSIEELSTSDFADIPSKSDE